MILYSYTGLPQIQKKPQTGVKYSECDGKKTYNSGDSLVVSYLTTNQPVHYLYMAERTGSLVVSCPFTLSTLKITVCSILLGRKLTRSGLWLYIHLGLGAAGQATRNNTRLCFQHLQVSTK